MCERKQELKIPKMTIITEATAKFLIIGDTNAPNSDELSTDEQ